MAIVTAAAKDQLLPALDLGLAGSCARTGRGDGAWNGVGTGRRRWLIACGDRDRERQACHHKRNATEGHAHGLSPSEMKKTVLSRKNYITAFRLSVRSSQVLSFEFELSAFGFG
jgi:hypothetical protein